MSFYPYSWGRYDDQVTFHIIFQGQFLPPSFSWKSIALFYQENKKREISSGEKEEGEGKHSRIETEEDDRKEEAVVEEISDDSE